MRISRETQGAHYQVTLNGHNQTYFVAKLVFFTSLALGNTLHFRFVNTVDFSRVMLAS